MSEADEQPSTQAEGVGVRGLAKRDEENNLGLFEIGSSIPLRLLSLWAHMTTNAENSEGVAAEVVQDAQSIIHGLRKRIFDLELELARKVAHSAPVEAIKKKVKARFKPVKSKPTQKAKSNVRKNRVKKIRAKKKK